MLLFAKIAVFRWSFLFKLNLKTTFTFVNLIGPSVNLTGDSCHRKLGNIFLSVGMYIVGFQICYALGYLSLLDKRQKLRKIQMAEQRFSTELLFCSLAFPLLSYSSPFPVAQNVPFSSFLQSLTLLLQC